MSSKPFITKNYANGTPSEIREMTEQEYAEYLEVINNAPPTFGDSPNS